MFAKVLEITKKDNEKSWHLVGIGLCWVFVCRSCHDYKDRINVSQSFELPLVPVYLLYRRRR